MLIFVFYLLLNIHFQQLQKKWYVKQQLSTGSSKREERRENGTEHQRKINSAVQWHSVKKENKWHCSRGSEVVRESELRFLIVTEWRRRTASIVQ